METRKDNITKMVGALFAVISSVARAGKGGEAGTLRSLRTLAEIDNARPSDIAVALELHQSTVTRRLQQLEKAGLVTMSTGKDDRRSSAVRLTDFGRRRLKELDEYSLSRFELFVAEWSVEEIRTFSTLLLKFNDSKAAVAEREQADAGKLESDLTP